MIHQSFQMILKKHHNEGNFTQIGKSLEAYCAAQKQVMEIIAHRENMVNIYSVAATFATDENGQLSKSIPKRGRVNGANSSYYKCPAFNLIPML
jgi:hypothetical protein